jgi:hypothetical protein
VIFLSHQIIDIGAAHRKIDRLKMTDLNTSLRYNIHQAMVKNEYEEYLCGLGGPRVGYLTLEKHFYLICLLCFQTSQKSVHHGLSILVEID